MQFAAALAVTRMGGSNSPYADETAAFLDEHLTQNPEQRLAPSS